MTRISSRWLRWLAVWMPVAAMNFAPGQEEIDYATLLPPIPPKEPEEALETFRVAKGLKIELVAAEPLIRDPMAIAFDEDGRLYVVEFPEYNQRWAEGGLREGDHGRVKLLEDTDGDGRMDTSTVFADELDYASAVCCWDGGIFLGVAPDILFLKDTDGDGRADHREVVLTGFSREVNRAGQAPLNSFRWGLDNRIHVSTNFSGGAISSPRHPDKPPLTIRNRDIVFDPLTWEFEATSGGGQHGMCFDDWGRKFVCRNSEPVKMIFYDDRYLANNPYLSAPPPAVDITEHGKYTRLFSISPEEPWRILRTRLRSEKKFRGSTEGPEGKPAVSGYFTAATGVMVYRGDALPREYRGDLFVGEAANNLVYRAKLEPDGVGLKAVRAAPESEGEFLASTDNWFRPVQLANGPDGALYVVDMYRFLIEGGAFLPPEALKHMDVRGGVDRGRIYRILPEAGLGSWWRERKYSTTPATGLATWLEHPSGWHRDTVARLLYQRQDPAAIRHLKGLAGDSPRALARMHALYALDGLGALEPSTVHQALGDDSEPHLLPHAIRLAETMADRHADIRMQVALLSKSDDPAVRYQAGFSLGTFDSRDSGVKIPVLTDILSEEGDDPWMKLAALSASLDVADEVFFRFFNGTISGRTRAQEACLVALVELIAESGDAEMAKVVVESVLSTETRRLDEEWGLRLLKVLLLNSEAETRRSLLSLELGQIRKVLDEMVTRAQATAFDPKAQPASRVSAVRLLEFAEISDVGNRMPDLLKPDQPAEIRRTAIEVLGQIDDDAVGRWLIGAWPSLGPESRAQVVDTLLSRPAWAMRCLEAVEAGTIGRGELGPVRRKQLAEHPSAEIQTKAVDVLGKTAAPDRAAVIARYRPALEAEGNFEKGRAVFRKACVACHRLENVGVSIGANLVGIGKSGAESILLNILDPNRDVKPEHLMYNVTTKDGKTHGGMIRSESANGITLRRLDGSDIPILRVDIEKLNGLGISFMPEGLEAQIPVEEMADLLRYLVEVE